MAIKHYQPPFFQLLISKDPSIARMIPKVQAYSSDGEEHEPAEVSRTEQVQRDNALMSTSVLG